MDTPSLSSIEGFSWQDLDLDGIQDTNEPVLEDVSVFLDSNDNGLLDTNEPKTVTDTTGHYEFKDVLTGVYDVRVDVSDEVTVTLPKTDTPHIPFTGLEVNNQGLVGLNTTNRVGHPTGLFGNAYYYLVSPDFGDINPDSPGAIQGEEAITGFTNVTEALADNEYTPEDLNVKFDALNLGDDIRGEDWFAVGDTEIRYYTGEDLTIQIDGEDIISASVDRFTLVIDYNIENPGIDNISGWVDIGSLEDISQDSSPKAQAIAGALLRDIDDQDVTFVFDSIQPATQVDFVGNGVTGAFFESGDVSFAFADTNIVSDSGYQLIVEPGEALTDINFGLTV
jgi:hypothetical protein